MNILQTNKAYYPVVGGIETNIRNLARSFARCPDVDVRVLVCSGHVTMRDERATVDGVPVTYAASMGKALSMPLSLSYVRHLWRERADIVHVHSPFPLADLTLMLSGWKRKTGARIVLTWHNDIVRQKLAGALYSPVVHRFLAQVDRVIVGAPNNISSSRVLSQHRDKCEVIPFGIDLDWVDHEPSTMARAEEIRKTHLSPLILFVGRLVYYKGIEFLIDAMTDVAGASLVIVGSGPLEKNLRAQIDRRKLGHRVSILHPVPEAELHALYHACDVFVLPSSEPTEGFGVVQVEAMACGKPVIATNLPTGVTFVNQHGVTGLFVPPKDSRALADAINVLMADPSLRERLGANGRRRAFQEFTIQKMIDRTMELYRRLLGLPPDSMARSDAGERAC